MPKIYTIVITQTKTYEFEVTAENETEARVKAENRYDANELPKGDISYEIDVI